VCASGGDLFPLEDLVNGSYGSIYVTGFGQTAILTFDGRTGEFIDKFISGHDLLAAPSSMAFSAVKFARVPALSDLGFILCMALGIAGIFILRTRLLSW
jgi:hypothetical protein